MFKKYGRLNFKLLSNKYSKLKVKCLMPFLLLIYYLVGIGWDLPSNLNGDECISLNAMYTIKNNYGNHDLRFYGSPYIYLNTILVGFYFLLSYILGLCKNTNDFIINFIKDPTIIILIGRMISVFCGILLFFVIKKLSKKLNKKDPNIYPSLLFCVSSLAIYWIHFAKLDIMASFNLSLLYIIKSL